MTQTLQDSFERCCRLCAEEQDVTIMIFSKEAEAMLLQNKLNRYLLIEVDEDDKLPKNICIQCCTKLQSACDFIATARKAQEVLLERSYMIDQIISNKCMISVVKHDITNESEDCYQKDKYTEMEVNVDPLTVLQNSEDNLEPVHDHGSSMEDAIYLHHGLDTENVTIKLIKKGEIHSDNQEKNNQSQVSNGSDDDDDGDDEKKGPFSKPFQCTSCERSFCTDLALKNHTWTHFSEKKVEKNYTCQTCFEDFKYKYDLISHLKEHRKNGLCQLCGRTFRTERTYVAHMTVHLPSSKSYTCKICGRSYSTWGGLKTHNVTHSAERPYHCQVCMKTFKRNQDLKFHINQHTGAKPFQCPFCERCFASSGNCYSHRSRMHPGELPENHIKTSNPPKPGVELPHQPIAPNPTNTQDNLKTQQPNNTIKLVTVNGVTKFQCHLCDHKFAMKDNFSYHMFQHTGEKPFRCKFCTDEFVTRRGLLIHHDNKHPGETRPVGLVPEKTLRT